jgi:hypothetical protein
MHFPSPRRLYSDADASRLDVIDNGRNHVGFINFATEVTYLGSIAHHSLTSDGNVDKRIWPASAAFGTLKSIQTNRNINLKVNDSVQRFAWAFCLTAAKFGACGKT